MDFILVLFDFIVNTESDNSKLETIESETEEGPSTRDVEAGTPKAIVVLPDPVKATSDSSNIFAQLFPTNVEEDVPSDSPTATTADHPDSEVIEDDHAVEILTRTPFGGTFKAPSSSRPGSSMSVTFKELQSPESVLSQSAETNITPKIQQNFASKGIFFLILMYTVYIEIAIVIIFK